MINPPLYFNNFPIYALYNTCEEIKPIEQTSEETEHFFHVYENESFVKFLKGQGYTDSEVRRECDAMEKVLNPNGYQSEAERNAVEEYEPV